MIRASFHYSWTGDVIAAVIMTFSSFGYYGQIWFNRAYTYECAIEEMPAGYGDTLMRMSLDWALPAVIIIGVILSVLIRRRHSLPLRAKERKRAAGFLTRNPSECRHR